MAVTKQTYTASATWTASQAADALRDAFIGAGLMTAWYDDFTDGSLVHRILEVEYDGLKTYGTCYYWFIFTTTGMFVSIASGWNNSTNVPTGTQYLDYFSTATNTTANHAQIGPALSTGTTFEIVRYTAGGISWFALRNGAVPQAFTITPGNANLATWLDLDKVLFHHFIVARPVLRSPTLAASAASVPFLSVCDLRRSYIAQGYHRGITSSAQSYKTFWSVMQYSTSSNDNNATSNGTDIRSISLPTTLATTAYAGVLVPYGFNNVNPAYATDYHPVINGYTYSNYVTDPMPNDFGLAFSFTTTTFAFGDTIVVSAGVEEWEVLDFANNANASAGKPLLLARVV
jgi:hypothetical protein